MNLPTSLLQPFLDHAVSISSIVALGGEPLLRTAAGDVAGGNAVLLRPAADDDQGGPATGAWQALPLAQADWEDASPRMLAGVAEQARELAGREQGIDALLLPAELMQQAMPPVDDEIAFHAVIAIEPRAAARAGSSDAWELQRSLFDRGLICIASVRAAGVVAHCFLASNAIRSLRRLGGESRGQITMATLTENGRFANQLFRYAYVRLYALRHGLTPAFPAWEGQRLYGHNDRSCAGLTLPRLSFPGFSDDDRPMWERDDPPVDVDLEGYFQEIPACWQRHRPLLRRLFRLSEERVQALDAWCHQVTAGGRRALIAVHVRRGDYRELQIESMPWLRLVPVEWYLDWLREIWPRLRSPLLYVATDEPETIRPLFREFESAPQSFNATARALPDHVRDFEILRRADHLAICNSSFSRLAAILAPATQRAYLPSFDAQRFVPYEPWIDPAFWARFADPWRGEASAPTIQRGPRQPAVPAKRPEPAVATMINRGSVHAPEQPTQILFDASDLVSYLLYHPTLSGIQRVQYEVLRHLIDVAPARSVQVVALDNGVLGTIDNAAILDVVAAVCSGGTDREDIEQALRALLNRMGPCTVRPRDIFLTIGAFWSIGGTGRLLQELKDAQAIIGTMVHDLLPIVAPEFFGVRDASVFTKGIVETLTFADFVLTTSEFNRTCVVDLMASRNLDPLPVHLAPLACERPHALPAAAGVSKAVADVLDTDYVLCVGTLEVRKNPAYLFHIWKLMLRSARADIPTLVFVGRMGWLVDDFMDQLAACNYLGGRIIVLHDVTDVELDRLYRKCMLTMFPSFLEGWGLPVGESLAHGKICLCSALGGVPDVGGARADYIDPYNAQDGLAKLTHYLDHPELRRSRERDIVERFQPRSWRKVADDFLRSIQALARQARPSARAAAIALPPGRFLPISGNAAAVPMDAIDGGLSAELICVSGWHPPDASGARAGGPATSIRFRTAAPVGARITLIMRLAAQGRPFRIQIRSGSGAETEAALAVGADRVAVLSCNVEPGNLVSARLASVDAATERESATSHWLLKGILYFEPKALAAEAAPGAPVVRSAAAQSMSAPVALAPSSGRGERPAEGERLLLGAALTMGADRCAPSFGAFLQSSDCWWPSESTSDLDAPIFADQADRRAFYTGCGNSARAPRVGPVGDAITLNRRNDVFVSMARFSEGAIFDRSGVWHAMGFLGLAPAGSAAWLSNAANGLSIDARALADAPRYEGSYLVFYNGNLHNHYHWLIEGLLCLDILSRAMGPGAHLKIALPKSRQIAAVFDHRETLRATGLDEREIVDVAADLIRVEEAIWVGSDLVQTMPAPYLKDFQQRIAARHAHLCSPRNRRLLIARRGPTRTIANLEQVEVLLSRYGFETVYLEGRSMLDQILLFQSAEFVISPHGAGLANLIFCEPGTKVIELSPSCEFRPFFWLIAEKVGLVHGLQFCATTAGEGFQGAISVDVAKLQALVRMLDAHL